MNTDDARCKEDMKMLEKILNEIDAATEPKIMTKNKAMDFLSRLVSELECRIDALRDELANDDNH